MPLRDVRVQHRLARAVHGRVRAAGPALQSLAGGRTMHDSVRALVCSAVSTGGTPVSRTAPRVTRASRPCERFPHAATLSFLIALFLFLAQPAAAEPLPGTKPLTAEGDLASQMVDGIDRFLLSETAAAAGHRAENWKRTANDPLAQRVVLLRMIGGLDPRLPRQETETVGTSQQVGHGDGFDVLRVRWAVLPGVFGEGLLLRPHVPDPRAYVIALPDADQTPQQIVGLVDGVAPESQFARRLAESGCWVVVPALVSRDDTCSVTDGG